MNFGTTFLATLLAVVAGSVVTFVFWIVVFSGLSTAFQTAPTTIPESAILKIDLKESIVDAPSKNPMASFDFNTLQPTAQVTLFNALKAIDAAKNDDRIKGIYINLNGGGSVSINLLEELRTSIEDFKQSGKWVVAYNDVYSQWSYYLSSVADKVYIQPEGSFEWVGIAANSIFFKGLFDKLGVKVDILRPTVCKYKSAVEPFFLTKMSDANRQQMQEMVDNMWAVLTDAVASSRGIEKAELNRLADELAVMLPAEAVEHKLIDGEKYADEVEDFFQSEYGIDEPKYVTLGEYASGLKPNIDNVTAPKVAILYANGDIVDGSGSDDKIYGYTFANSVREVAEDDDIKAVVMRVNSPGGSALASDIIWREVELLKAKKPVIVSMGSYAASGGYYISAPADAIVADRLTLTGSIGVFGMLPSYGKALENKVGITFDGVTTNKYSDLGNGMDPLNDAEYKAMMRGVDRVYGRFTSLVAEGRNLTIEKVLDIAEGRVWSGVQAQQIGLVDSCGGLNAALAIAVDKAELGDNFQIVEYTEPLEGIMAILQGMNVKVRQAISARSELGELYNEYQQIESMIGKKGVYARCPYIFRFN
ncbi:MAG: signal peptide peptidase SppA [Alistipes sp.]|nr:signal peptide peptidase SppA [Alistipes sp.]